MPIPPRPGRQSDHRAAHLAHIEFTRDDVEAHPPGIAKPAIGNVGKQREATASGHGSDGDTTEGCCNANHATLKPRSHDTSRKSVGKTPRATEEVRKRFLTPLFLLTPFFLRDRTSKARAPASAR